MYIPEKYILFQLTITLHPILINTWLIGHIEKQHGNYLLEVKLKGLILL